MTASVDAVVESEREARSPSTRSGHLEDRLDRDLEAKAEPEMKRRRTLSSRDACACPLVDWLRSSAVAVHIEVADGSRKEEFRIHEGALRQLPYFDAYASRWTKGEGPCKLQLPPDVEIEDFEHLMARVYSTCRCSSVRKADCHSDLKRAVAYYLLVDLMLVERLLPEAFTGICCAVRSTEHLEELRAWAMKPCAKVLAKVVSEIEAEREEPFLADLVRSVIGDGNRVLGTPEVLDLKTSILQDRLQERAELGLQNNDTQVVLEVLKANAWIGTVYYDQPFKVSPKSLTVWSMIEPNITSETLFTVARGLANELDRPAAFNRVGYRGEQRYSLAFSGNREMAVELLQGIVRVGTRLAEQGVVPWSEVMLVLPVNYEATQVEAILRPALADPLFQIELLVPHLKRLSLEFLAKLLRTSPRVAARKIARCVFLDEAALKPNEDVFQVIRELRLV